MYGLYHAVARRKGVQSTPCYTCCLKHVCERETYRRQCGAVLTDCFNVSKAMIIMSVLVVFV